MFSERISFNSGKDKKVFNKNGNGVKAAERVVTLLRSLG